MAQHSLHERLNYKLFEYICDNNPDLLFQLEEEKRVTAYLHEKVAGVVVMINEHATEPEYILEERCMALLTKDLQPSRYNYICHVLEEEFAATYQQLIESGTLKTEGVNLIRYCNEVFDAMHFSEANEDNKLLYYAVAGSIVEYFDKAVGQVERSVSWGTTAGKN